MVEVVESRDGRLAVRRVATYERRRLQMAIRFTHVLYSAALIGATTLITSQVISQDDHDHDHPHGDHDHAHGEHAAAQADMDAMMEAWMKTAQPGAEHAEMQGMVGEWHLDQKHWMYPGAEPETMESKAKMKPIMGGRFIMEHVHGKVDLNGEMHDFKGMGIFGFDNISKKHTFVWLDNMSTTMMVAHGERNEDGDIVYMSEMPNPMTGETMEVKSVSRVIDEDKNMFMMFKKGEDGAWFKDFELTATRE